MKETLDIHNRSTGQKFQAALGFSFGFDFDFVIMLKTTALFSRRVLSSSINAGQEIRQMGTAAEVARQRRSLKDRVAIVTASTDG